MEGPRHLTLQSKMEDMNMTNPITIREACTQKDTEFFWAQLHAYQARDLFPDPESEARAFFLSAEYRGQIQALHDRKENPMHYLLFRRGGQEIGLALTVVYATEDGKQSILEFCVFPEFRGNGTGTACARALLDWGKKQGAAFAELNAGAENRRRFWSRLGFIANGRDRWGEPLMLLPPRERIAVTAERLTNPEELWDLESGFLAEIGEAPMEQAAQTRLEQAISGGEITFFVARRLNRPVGICSVSSCFSTFACKKTGVFDDFYVEPAFRHQGVARTLVAVAQSFCRAQGYASLTVGCADGDVAMYRALGFGERLGTMLANNF